MTRAAEAQGRVADGYEPVAQVFAETLAEDAGGGAAFAAVVDGQMVVDLWGGVADGETGAPWREDTIQLVFSGTKGFVAACLLILIERGDLDLEAPVARYWPEFRDDVLVRHVVSHTAGLPGLRRPMEAADLLDGEWMARLVAEEEPFWEPGSRVAYHALTFGWLCGELVRRIDGRSLGRFFAEEVAAPLGLELWIGLPPELEPRVARLQRSDDYGITFLGDEPDPLLEALYGPLLDSFPWNDSAFCEAEIPAANAIGTARSIGRLYGSLPRIVGEATLLVGRTELSRGLCAVTQRPYAFGVGFELQTELGTLGPPGDAFGHTGSGGSRHGAWPTQRVGFSYSMSVLRPEAGDTRATRLLTALYETVSR